MFPDGAKKHECVGGRYGCAYLMIWKPTEPEVGHGRD